MKRDDESNKDYIIRLRKESNIQLGQAVKRASNGYKNRKEHSKQRKKDEKQKKIDRVQNRKDPFAALKDTVRAFGCLCLVL